MWNISYIQSSNLSLAYYISHLKYHLSKIINHISNIKKIRQYVIYKIHYKICMIDSRYICVYIYIHDMYV